MNRPECIFHIISCRFIALSGAFYPSYCGKWAEKAQELYLFLDHDHSGHLVAFYSFLLCHCAQQQDTRQAMVNRRRERMEDISKGQNKGGQGVCLSSRFRDPVGEQ